LQIGRLKNWSRIASNFVDYAEREGEDIVAEATGWQSPARKYSFFYVPSLRGEVPILPDKSSLDLKISPIISRSFKLRKARDAKKPKARSRQQ
jgi:hypothetical protein